MRKFKFIYAGIGILLLIACIVLGSRGLQKKDKELYQKAYELSDKVEQNLWPGYSFKNYPTAIRRGNFDYVLHGTTEKKRRAALPVIAATAYMVEGEINIFLPSKADLDSIGQLAEGISSGSDMFFMKGFALESGGLSDNRYVAILYHEGLHAFQIDKYKKKLFDSVPANYEEHEIIQLIDRIDKSPKLRALYERENELIYSIVKAEGVAPDKVDQYIELRKGRMAALSSEFEKAEVEALLWLENYYEKVEGTARYTEAKLAELLEDEKLFGEYIGSLKENAPGKEKYYRSGMGICLILDKLQREWKKDVFTGSHSMFEILMESTEGF